MRIKTPLIALASSAAAFTGIALGGTATSAFAYGSADKPVAQVEISGNCDNPNFWFCSQVVGTGGIWAWAELDNIASTNPGTLGWHEMDATVADCGHVQGGAPPHTSGGSGGPDPIGVWNEYSSLDAAEQATGGAAQPLLLLGSGNPYTGSVYVLDFFPGSGSNDFEVVVPVTRGHYSAQPAPAVSLQIQVAP